MSARWARAFSGAVLAALGLLLAVPARAEGRLEAFRRLRAEGVAAARAGDTALARTRIEAAVALMPAHPGALILLARLKVADDPAAAVAVLARHAGLGLVHDAGADPSLKSLTVRDDYAPVAARLAANRAATGRPNGVASLEGPVLAEGVAHDPRTGRLLVSQVHGRKIVTIGGDGAISAFTAPADDVWGVFGLAADPSRRTLWALTAATPQARDIPADLLGATALLRIDLDTGQVLARHVPSADGVKRQFGDLALGPDGAVYVSNSLGGEVWRLKPGAGALDRLVASPEIGSAQGLAVTADAAHLVVADYSSGLHRIDLASGAETAVETPADLTLLGVDGLVRDGDGLIVVQNGVNPQRILRLALSPDGARVTAATVLAANLPQLDEPTGGAMLDGRFVFVARSQWSDFGDDGLKTPAPAPAQIVSVQVRP